MRKQIRVRLYKSTYIPMEGERLEEVKVCGYYDTQIATNMDMVRKECSKGLVCETASKGCKKCVER